MFIVQVQRNAKLIAVPLFELHENATRFGMIIAALPHILSRFKLTLAGSSLPSQPSENAEEERGSKQHAA